MYKKNIFIMIFILFLIIFGISEKIDKSKIPRLKWMGPKKPGTYQEYLSKYPIKPLNLEKINLLIPSVEKPTRKDGFSLSPLLIGKKVIIIVNTNLYSLINSHINQYIKDIKNKFSYNVMLFKMDGGSHKSLKNILTSNKNNLAGCVLIGQLPSAWYEISNDYDEYGYVQFPCDLFFMDLDGQWIDSDVNDMYDSHINGGGDTSPEIFIARIDASGMSGDEIGLYQDYFEKNHNYWMNNKFIMYGLTYTEDDWAEYSDMLNDIRYLYPDSYQAIAAPDTTKEDYLNNRLINSAYTLLQLACHSSSTSHYFTRGDALHNDEVINAPPQALAYNLFCCSSLRYTEQDYLGGAYLFNTSLRTLVLVGSTKTGSMLQFDKFYTPLGANKNFGTALKEWFEKIAPYDKWDVFWHYGMHISGDPFVMFFANHSQLILAPENITYNTEENYTLTMTECINVIKWDQNPQNQSLSLKGYRIYQLRGEFKLLAEVDLNTFEYIHRNVPGDGVQTYAVAAINHNGKEGLPAVIVVDK